MKKCFFWKEHTEMGKTLHKCWSCHAIIGNFDSLTCQRVIEISSEKIAELKTKRYKKKKS